MSDSRIDWWPPIEGTPASTDLAGSGAGAPPPPAQPPRRSRSSERQRAARQKSASRRNAIVAIVVAVLLLLGTAYVGWSLLGGNDGGDQSTGQPTVQDYPGPGAYPPVQVQINSGDTGAAMAVTLQQAGVVATQQAFVDAFAANPDAAKIQPGTYSLLKEMKASDAVAALLNPASRVSMKVTIPEGYTVTQIVQRINEVTLISVEDLDAALQDPTAIGLPAEAGGNPEGWLFPSTYQVEPGATAASVFKQMTDQTAKVLTQKGVAQDQWRDVLTKASMVEREAGRDEDRPLMARAIENRLAKGMFLDVDATVSYGLGKTGAPTGAETDDASNPYNTYKHTGLPPTPIASPGASSIDAVLNPADGDWLFWVCVNFDTKETKFATTLDEQNQNVAEMKAWVAANATPSATATP